jgi:hypothetical protein
MNVTIVGNFNVTSTTGTANFLPPGKWYDYFKGDSIVASSSQSFTLAPGEFHIYTTQRLPTPDPGIVENVEDNSAQVVNSYKLYQNYPNPFNPSTEIKYQVFNQSKVVIKIYDLMGNEVKTLVNRDMSSGTFNVTWKGDNNFGQKVSSGVYFCRMESGTYVQTIKLMLMK